MQLMKPHFCPDNKMDTIISELQRIQTADECSDAFLETIKYVAYIYTQTNMED